MRFNNRWLLLLTILLLLVACGTTDDSTESAATAEPTTAAQEDTSAEPAAESDEPDTDSADAETTEMTPLKVVILPFISFAPYYIGVDEGYFADQGLDVELVNMTVQRDIVPALVSGQVDVASGLVSAGVLNAIARGGELKFVSDKGFVDPDGCDNYRLIARQELVESTDFNDPTAWDGMKVDVVPATWLEYYLDKQLAEIGVAKDQIVQSDLPVPAEPQALADGTIDITLNSEPWIVIHGNNGHVPVLSPVTELMADSQNAVMYFGPNLLNGDPSIGERFMIAYLQSVAQYNEGKTDRNLEILLNHIEMDPNLLENICWPTLRDDGTVNMESVLDFQDWAVANGVMDAPLTAEQIYDPSFVEAANAALGN